MAKTRNKKQLALNSGAGQSECVSRSACGRKRTLKILTFCQRKCPLSGKADVQIRILKIRYANGRITPGSSRWADIMLRGRYRPEADIGWNSCASVEPPGRTKSTAVMASRLLTMQSRFDLEFHIIVFFIFWLLFPTGSAMNANAAAIVADLFVFLVPPFIRHRWIPAPYCPTTVCFQLYGPGSGLSLLLGILL